MIKEHIRYIDLFCGIGGFHQALQDIGECVFACDNDIECQKTYEKNYGIKVRGDIREIKEEEIPQHDMLCAGFPCQSFSKAGKREGFLDKTKGTLFFDVLRIIYYHKPRYVLLENVRNIVTHDNGNTWQVIHSSLTDAGYNVSKTPIIISPHNIGIPQHRERVFIIGIRKDIGVLPPSHIVMNDKPTCNIDSILLDDDEIEDIDRYKLDERHIQWIDNWNIFIQTIRCKKMPSFPIWADSLCLLKDNPLYPRWNTLPKWKQDIIKKNALLYENNKEFIDRWLDESKRYPLFFGAKTKLEWQVGDTSNHNLWDYIMQIRPSGLRVKTNTSFPALVAMNQTSIIGKRKRYITPRECARLQSFPDDFICNDDDKVSYKQFGNSVNVEVVKMILSLFFNKNE